MLITDIRITNFLFNYYIGEDQITVQKYNKKLKNL